MSYGCIVCEIRPQKEEKERTRLTVGGDKLPYNGPTSTEIADITTAKLVVNSTISTPQARFVVFDIKNFYLGTPMQDYEYIRLHISILPDEIINKYRLRQIMDEGSWVYLEIKKRMYGLKQAGRLANERLQANLKMYGYYPSQHI